MYNYVANGKDLDDVTTTISLKNLVEMYNVSKNDSLVSYTFKHYGFYGVTKVDLSMALGIMSDYLSKPVSFIDHILAFAKDNREYSSILTLIIDIFVHMIQYPEGVDERLDVILHIIRNIDVDDFDYNRLELNRWFICSILHAIKNNIHEVDGYTYDNVFDSIVSNPSVKFDSLIVWAKNYPEISRYYVVNCLEIERKIRVKNPLVYFESGKYINKTTDLIGYILKYMNQIRDLDESGGSHKNLDKELVSLINDIVEEINLTGDGEALDLFLNTSYSSYLHGSYEREVITLLWVIFALNNEDTIEQEENMVDLIENDTRQGVSVIYEFNDAISKGNSRGLIYALFYHNVKSKFREILEFSNVNSEFSSINLDKIEQNLISLINNSILPQEYTDIKELKRIFKEMYPDIDLFDDDRISETITKFDDMNEEQVLDMISNMV